MCLRCNGLGGGSWEVNTDGPALIQRAANSTRSVLSVSRPSQQPAIITLFFPFFFTLLSGAAGAGLWGIGHAQQDKVMFIYPSQRIHLLGQPLFKNRAWREQ